MEKPEVAANRPCVHKLEPGTYWWCSCGRSAGQPWCDGSHKGTGFTPVKVEVEERKDYALCACKHTQGQPFCDGSHKRLPPRDE